jgi:hypothetical protein
MSDPKPLTEWQTRRQLEAATGLRKKTIAKYKLRGLAEMSGLPSSHNALWRMTPDGVEWLRLHGRVVPAIAPAAMPPVQEPASPVLYDPGTDKYIARNGRTGAYVGQLGGRVRAIAEALLDSLDMPTPRVPPARPPLVASAPVGPQPVILYLGLTDLHFGLGDSDELRADIDRRVARILATVEGGWGQPAHILLPVGSDALHVDTIHGTTTKGTAVHPTVTAAEAYDHAVRWYLDTVQALRARAADRVHLVYCAGNHDRLLSHTIMRHLCTAFGAAQDVEIHHQPADWTTIQIGRTLWHVEHGDRKLGPRIGDLMARHPGWSSCPHRIALTGHRHHLEAKDEEGYTRVQCRAMARASQYDRQMGWEERPGVSAVVADMREGLAAVLP